MNIAKKIMNYLAVVSIWKFLRIIAVLTIVWVVYSISAEAYSLSQVFVWLQDKMLELTWEPPEVGSDHYRLEISKTDLLSEPVSTSLSFSYTDDTFMQFELQDDHSYMFRVQGVDKYGALSDFSDSTSLFIYDGGEIAKQVARAALPVEFSLSQNFPNPFNSRTTIEYQISGPGTGGSATEVNLVIYNILGQRVRVLIKENQIPGKHHIIWDGFNDNGQQVASGNYIYQLMAGKYKTSKKMVFMK